MNTATDTTATDKLITASEAAVLFGVSLSTYWKLINRGIAPPRIKMGSYAVRFSLADVCAAIERLKTTAAAAGSGPILAALAA
ncbi:DNA-binding protein [Rhizobium leguminosarum]|uniref:helix-turn-helix transcriptional regulator n=1 Tax=Rhizobium leguminosarum TaxID=384 RepID=UPI00103186D5|nr:DNA-binding protein [Rhizobium leguminosarum]TAU22561.1 DNA-binding protein [Rhizobium leguminosarum]TAU42557.1 DNA-binding protein [Rhizobium leguminosarum]